MQDGDTRRQAATEFTQALLVQFEQQITGITNGYIQSYLQVSCDASAEGILLTYRIMHQVQLISGKAKIPPFICSLRLLLEVQPNRWVFLAYNVVGVADPFSAWCHLYQRSGRCRILLWPKCFRRSSSRTGICAPYPDRRRHQVPLHIPQPGKF